LMCEQWFGRNKVVVFRCTSVIFKSVKGVNCWCWLWCSTYGHIVDISTYSVPTRSLQSFLGGCSPASLATQVITILDNR
jgi:hypothetical protein